MSRKAIALEVPSYLVDKLDGSTCNIRDKLIRGLNRYFDVNGDFKGININFKDDFERMDSNVIEIKKLAFTVENEEYDKLKKIKEYTTLSYKKIAEIIVIKELIEYV